MEDYEKRIDAVLGADCDRSHENGCRYRDYLRTQLSLPLRVTGIEDFPWEEPYVFGVRDQDKYEELKKTKPSYTDEFDLLSFGSVGDEDIMAEIRRISDGKVFQHELAWLKCVNEESPEYVVLNDYAIWHTNY